MQNGVVKKWDRDKGFGFIEAEDGDELFVHLSDLHVTVNLKRLIEGQHVSFDIRSDMKGDRAVNVRVIK
jgi:CspA family cold shock protein